MIGGAKGIGLGIDLGLVNQYNRTGSQSYIEPEVLDSLVGVWSAYGMTNDSPNRSTIKNKLSNKGGDFVISNAAFKLNSGFGKYSADFESFDWAISISQKQHNKATISLNGRLCNHAAIEVDEMKVNIIGNVTELIYWYIANPGDTTRSEIRLTSGINTLPKSYAKDDGQTYNIGFAYISGDSEITIEQIPSFEGAFVTDGIDDLITSTKSATEMLDGSNEITVVSMIHQIGLGCRTNFICDKGSYWRCNEVANTGEGKTGIYGYSSTNISVNTPNIINNVLGDKVDYSVTGDRNDLTPSQFSVVGYISSSGKISYTSSVAWYWTIIANKVLTSDQINQVIAYYNLDRCVEPTVWYDVQKQGLTNDTPDSDWYLKDFSKNGFDMSLFNFAKKGNSGVGKYETDFLDSSIWKYKTNSSVTSDKIVCNKAATHIMLLYYSITDGNKYDVPSFNVLKQGDASEYYYIDEQGIRRTFKLLDGINTLPASHGTLFTGTEATCGFGNPGIGNSVTITQIPSHAGALCLDGVNDFGKVTGMPIYKDYTVVADYQRFYLEPITGGRASILSKSSKVGDGSFIFNLEDQNGGKACYTFGEANGNISDDITRIIRYQSKYYNTKALSIGTAEDNDFMVLGKVREVDNRYFYGAIYSLMSFPYSMSEFLIERQLKKHKLGTLYPDMVEFRPVIKSNVLLDAKPTFVIRGTSTYLNAGDYVPENSQIWVSIKMNNIADRITKFTVNGKTIDIPENAYSEVTLQYGFPFVIDKSPQKISITIEQDENYVLFNPVINSNYDNYKLTFHLREYEKLINIGDYIPKGTYIRANLYLKNDIDELVTFTFNGVNIDYAKSPVLDTAYNIRQIYNYDSPQEVNITIDEYIRYEDIVQPYPVLLRFNDENGNEVSWGDKIKVGSSITRIGSAADSNLLPNIYNIFGLLLNGNQVTSSKVIVEKTMVFKAKSAYIFDNNEPKVILSPRLLRIPNSSYKILGYIPDISGHGNHGKINNSAYASMSGANGYLLDFKTFTTGNSSLVNIKDDSRIEVININKEKSTTFVNLNKSTSISLSSWKIKVTGMKSGDTLGYYYSESTDATLRSKFDIKSDGIYSLPSSIANSNNIGGIAFDVVAGADSAYRIEQIGEYEGAYCFDGVDDFVTIPTLSSGGKQVLMKVNWHGADDEVLYDQRNSNIQGNYDLAISTYPDTIAYNFRNEGGKTFIDGILNHNIVTNNLKSITHNITSINGYNNDIDSTVRIGRSVFSGAFSKMALYDFMLFDNISTDDKIKELNEYVGIEAKVELPPYYWDAYGKTNLDGDKATIQQRGVAVGDFDLTNNNLAYEGMSGYNGYPVVFGANKTWEQMPTGTFTWNIDDNKLHITKALIAGNGLLFSYVKLNGSLLNVKEIPSFKIKVSGLEGKSKLWYRYLKTEDAISETIAVLENGTHELPKSYIPSDSLHNGTWVGFTVTPISEGVKEFDCDITIEVLPEYENGLVYDGVDDYSKNENIPVLTDYTIIAKRLWINKDNPLNEQFIHKGAINAPISESAFMLEYEIANDTYYRSSSYGGYINIERSNRPERIVYQTSNSYNGTSITKGSGTDTTGIVIGGVTNNYWNGVFYKLMLYSKTLPLLQINYLKNLMEKDEIIDLNNKIFIQ